MRLKTVHIHLQKKVHVRSHMELKTTLIQLIAHQLQSTRDMHNHPLFLTYFKCQFLRADCPFHLKASFIAVTYLPLRAWFCVQE